MSISKIITMETENEEMPAPMHGKLSAVRLSPFVPVLLVPLGDGALQHGWGVVTCLLLDSYVSNPMFGL